MAHLEDVSVEQLQAALADQHLPTQRLLAAIAYKHGISQTALANWFGIERKTIYNWLTRFDHQDIQDAIYDRERIGRPPKLSPQQQKRFVELVTRNPRKSGYDTAKWTTKACQDVLRQEFGVEYTRPSCRRLMREAGLQCQKITSGTSEQSAHNDGRRYIWT